MNVFNCGYSSITVLSVTKHNDILSIRWIPKFSISGKGTYTTCVHVSQVHLLKCEGPDVSGKNIPIENRYEISGKDVDELSYKRVLDKLLD
jgi:hypothetical protein